MRRVTFSLPDEMVADLRYTARVLGISRSSLITQVSQGALGEMARQCRALKQQPTDDTVRRLRGESQRFIEREVAKVYRELGK